MGLLRLGRRRKSCWRIAVVGAGRLGRYQFNVFSLGFPLIVKLTDDATDTG